MTPIFLSQNIYDTGYGKCVGADESHLRLTVTDSSLSNSKITGIGFGLGDKYELISNKKPCKMAYSIDENHWNGRVSLQLKIRDIKP